MANLIYSAALTLKTVANRIVFQSEFLGALEELSNENIPEHLG